MKTLSAESQHWTDEQLIAFLYGAGPENEHLAACPDCRGRLSALEANRQALEQEATSVHDVSPAFLAAQRRRIYGRLSEPVFLWQKVSVRRWASAGGMLLMLGSGFVIFEQYRYNATDQGISDVQLAQEMSRMSQDLEAQPVAPLQGLFE